MSYRANTSDERIAMIQEQVEVGMVVAVYDTIRDLLAKIAELEKALAGARRSQQEHYDAARDAHHRADEAEHDLEDNDLKLRDRIAELEAEREPGKGGWQEQAAKFQQRNAELKGENRTHKESIKILEERRLEQQERIAELEATLDVRHEHINKLEAKVAELEAEAKLYQGESMKRGKRIAELEAERDRLLYALESFDPADVSASELRGAQREAKDCRKRMNDKQRPESGQ